MAPTRHVEDIKRASHVGLGAWSWCLCGELNNEATQWKYDDDGNGVVDDEDDDDGNQVPMG